MARINPDASSTNLSVNPLGDASNKCDPSLNSTANEPIFSEITSGPWGAVCPTVLQHTQVQISLPLFALESAAFVVAFRATEICSMTLQTV